jgi:voltage-gated potassium channel
VKTTQFLRAFSVAGAFLVGFWLPLRMIGVSISLPLEVTFDLLVSAVAGANIYLYFSQSGKSIRNPQDWMSVGLSLDIICVLPFSIIALFAFGHTATWLLLLNLLCARHIQQIRPFLDQFDSLQPITYRLVPIVLSLPLLVHLVACGWIALGSGTSGPDPDPVFNYVKGIYWAFTTLTTVGYGDISAKTAGQMLYACGVQVMGVGVFGFILSNVASLLSRMDAAREHHMDNLDKIDTFMRLHQIPVPMRAKTRAYFHYMWTHKKGYHDRVLLENLPAKLQSELLGFVNKPIVEKVPFLKGAQAEMIEDLMDKLEPRIFVPGERIFHVDEPGDALYFIQSGKVEIRGREGNIIATLGDGAFFGEMALLNDQPRSATAVATHFCDAYLLHKDSFALVSEAYPAFKDHFEQLVQTRKVS